LPTSNLDFADNNVASRLEGFQDAVVESRRMFPEFDADAETYVVGDWRAIIQMVAELTFNLAQVAKIAVDLVLNDIETKEFHLVVSSGGAMRNGRPTIPARVQARSVVELAAPELLAGRSVGRAPRRLVQFGGSRPLKGLPARVLSTDPGGAQHACEAIDRHRHGNRDWL
jgi:hypothetical protein